MRELKEILIDEFYERRPSETITAISKEIIVVVDKFMKSLNEEQQDLYLKIDSMNGDLHNQVEIELIEFIIKFYHKIFS